MTHITLEEMLVRLRQAWAAATVDLPPIEDVGRGEVHVLVVFKQHVSSDGPELVGLADSPEELKQLIQLHRLSNAAAALARRAKTGRRESNYHDEITEAAGVLAGEFSLMGNLMGDTGMHSFYETYFDSVYQCYVVAKPDQTLRLQVALWATPQIIE